MMDIYVSFNVNGTSINNHNFFEYMHVYQKIRFDTFFENSTCNTSLLRMIVLML